MKKIIQIMGEARSNNKLLKELWLETADFEGMSGFGIFRFTEDKEKAKRFDTFQEAAEFCHTIPACRPKRQDGKTNRPLTAYQLYIMDENLHA